MSPEALQLLDFLCAAKQARCNVTRLKGTANYLRLSALWDAALIHHGTFEPTAWAMHDWQVRRQFPKFTDPVPLSGREPKLAPSPEAQTEGDGDSARKVAPSPIDLERLLDCFRDEFERLSTVADRYGAKRPQDIVRWARTLHEMNRVEWLPPTKGRAFLLWRRVAKPKGPAICLSRDDVKDLPPAVIAELSAPARKLAEEVNEHSKLRSKFNPSMAEKARRFEELPRQRGAHNRRNTRGACRTAREAPAAEESTPAKRIEDRAPPQEPASAVAPSARAHPVDIKVNIGPRIRHSAPAPVSNESQEFHREQQKRLRTNREKAEAFLDSGKTSQDASSVSLKIEARKVELRRAEAERLLDPIELAKAVLRKRYRPVISAETVGGRKGYYIVGQKTVTKNELLEMAGMAA